MKFTQSYYSVEEWLTSSGLGLTPNSQRTRVINVAEGKLVELWFPTEPLPDGLIFEVSLAGRPPELQRVSRTRTHEHSGVYRFSAPCVVHILVRFVGKQLSHSPNLPEPRNITYVGYSPAHLEASKRALSELRKSKVSGRPDYTGRRDIPKARRRR